MSDILHGLNASRTNYGEIPPLYVYSGVHVVVGRPPVLMLHGKVDEVLSASV